MNYSVEFTLVTTVFNESNRLNETIDNIEGQTLLPNQIVIVDAGSTDGTYEKLLQWKLNSTIPIKIIQNKGCNVAKGRNIAIQNSDFHIIVSTDFGCTYHKDWLKSLITKFIDSDIEVVGGNFTVKESNVKTLAAKADYILQNGYKNQMDENFSVSSRSIAYKKYLWQQIGGYNEWLTLAADDTIFWREIVKRKYKYKFVNEAYVYWNRHENFKQFKKEVYRYGLGDGESKINFKNFVSHCIETILRYSIIFTFVLAFVFHYYFLFLLILQVFGLRSYFRGFYYWLNLRNKKYHVGILLVSFYLIEISRITYIVAYIKGWLFKSIDKRNQAEKLKIN